MNDNPTEQPSFLVQQLIDIHVALTAVAAMLRDLDPAAAERLARSLPVRSEPSLFDDMQRSLLGTLLPPDD